MFAWGCTIRIIPSDPTFVPSMPVQQKVRQLVRVLAPLAAAIDSEVFDGPVYIGCHYATWGGVCCPLCAADLDGWWWQALERAIDPITKYARLDAILPCCGHTVSLNDLEFGEEVGFARFVIDIEDANRDSLFVDEDLAAVERTLGCSVRQVLYYY